MCQSGCGSVGSVGGVLAGGGGLVSEVCHTESSSNRAGHQC